MATKPSIQPGEWISIGKQGLVKGVVCTVFRDTIQGDCEVVYLDMGNRAINEDVRWAGSYWEFVHGRGGGGYADQFDRLQPFVHILRGSTTPKVQRKRTRTGQRRRSRR
jgi:hypothetical protein